MKTTMRVTAALVFATALLAVGVGQASAKHAGESITVSTTTGLADGDTVRVTVAGFTPNANPVKLVIAGQGDLVTIPDKLNFDEYAVAPEVPIAANGTGATDFVMTSDHGTVQDGTTLDCLVDQCWLIAVQEPFLPQPNYASQAISFGNEPPPPPRRLQRRPLLPPRQRLRPRLRPRRPRRPPRPKRRPPRPRSR